VGALADYQFNRRRDLASVHAGRLGPN